MKSPVARWKVSVTGAVGHRPVEEEERLGLVGVAVQRGGGARWLGNERHSQGTAGVGGAEQVLEQRTHGPCRRPSSSGTVERGQRLRMGGQLGHLVSFMIHSWIIHPR